MFFIIGACVMSDNSDTQNLSEILFKPHFNYQETSFISNSGCEIPCIKDEDDSLGFSKDWYRPIRTFMWVFLGGNLLDIDEALANISTAQGERKRPECFDTIAQYGPGNWIYEFNAIAQRRVNLGADLEKQGEILKASHQYRMASRYFSIASYPFLRGDVLSSESLMHSRRIYKRMIEMDPTNGEISEETFSVKYQKVSGFLHLPDKTHVHPCVIMVSGYEQNVTDFYKFYNIYLRPKGIALFSIDMPGMGSCSKLTLSAESSSVVDAAISHLKNLKNIDSTHLGLCGMRTAGTACLRSAILNPSDIKAVSVIAPAVHSLFTDASLLNSLPLCVRSSCANRMGLDAASWDTIVPQVRVLSLKTQGLLSNSGKCPVPCSVFAVRNSLVSSEDIKLLEGTFKECRVDVQEKKGYSEFLLESLDQSAKFFASLLVD